jgi:hypothetical protein
MSDLDDKLQFALTQFDNNAPLGGRWETVMVRIKAAFESEGYAHYETVIQKEVNDQLQGIHEYYQEVYMSGQQFYDRFKAELDKQHYDINVPDDMDRTDAIVEGVEKTLLKAAARAAGVSDE